MYNTIFFKVFVSYCMHILNFHLCMDYLERNIDWLEEKLKPFLKGYYIISIIYFVDLHPK